jgi:predicted nucleic acid-binding protein
MRDARHVAVIGWLLDTNIVSEIRRPRPEPKVLAAIEAKPLEHLYISIVTLAEIPSASSNFKT